jgi:hypothetical protein
MNLADASLVVAAETLRLCNIFTLDRNDFDVYRIKRGDIDNTVHSYAVTPNFAGLKVSRRSWAG